MKDNIGDNWFFMIGPILIIFFSIFYFKLIGIIGAIGVIVMYSYVVMRLDRLENKK